MKKCTYCGKEYEDSATQCAIDAQPLTRAGQEDAAPPLLPRAALPPVLPVGVGELPPVINTFSELEKNVLAGGRFVIFQYCFSVVVMSFKRPSAIIYLPPGEDGAGAAVSNSMISLLVGWWGIPWGPIWTFWTVIKNACGGIDVTQAVLAEKVGVVRAAQVMAQRRVTFTASRGMKFFRAGLICLAALPLLFFVGSMLLAASQARSSHPGGRAAPGETQFRSANEHINGNQGFVGCGNSPKAVNIAVDFSNKMKKRRELMFEAAKPNRISVGTAGFVSCCELHDSQCAIIVNVPDLRRFSTEAKDSLGRLAWHTAQEALNQNGAARPGMKLAVGIRGVLLYDRVLLGNAVTNLEGADTSLFETITSSEPQQRLHPFFEKPASVPGFKDERENQTLRSAAQTNE